MSLQFKTGLFVVAAAILVSCEQTKQVASTFVPPTIDLPLKKEVIQYADFTYMPSEGATFQTERGTKLIFPVDAFVFEDGSKVTEVVQIKFREYHTASEILLSGIRMMATTDEGETLPFESAGMFDIDGRCGNKKIQIAPGKTAQIQLANAKTDTDFNFYKLDEKNGWAETQKNLPVSNIPVPEKIKQEAAAILPVKPLAPEKFDNNSFVFDLDMDTDKYPELKELYGIMWQYNGKKGSNTDPEKNKKITETKWTTSNISRNGDMDFNLNLRNKKESMNIPVKPVLSGKNYAEAKARYDQKMKNYSDAVTRKEEAAKKLDSQFEYMRALTISGFGIYNCDRFYKMLQTQTVEQPLFTVNNQELPAGTTIYHIAKDDIVIRIYDPKAPFKFGKKEANRLIAILPDQTVAAITKTEFEQASTKNLFNLKKLPVGKITPDVLADVIASI